MVELFRIYDVLAFLALLISILMFFLLQCRLTDKRSDSENAKDNSIEAVMVSKKGEIVRNAFDHACIDRCGCVVG